jgi:H+/Cl- antiporter ClcA
MGLTNLPVSNFTLVGMAGILSGLFHAPLTAYFLNCRNNRWLYLMLPLMIVASIVLQFQNDLKTFDGVKRFSQKTCVYQQ